MLVIHVLPDQSNTSLCVIKIKLRHVQVINKIYKSQCTHWRIKSTSFLFQRLLELSLKQNRIRVKIHINRAACELFDVQT